MTERELSWEEINNLYKLSLIPTLLVFFVVLIYFNYLMYADSLKSVWDGLLHVGPLFTAMPIVFFLTFEALYHRKLRKPLRFHLKRFIGRILPLLASALSYFGFLIFIVNPFLSPIMGDRGLLVGSVLWIVIFFLVVMRFRKILAKLDSGNW